MGALETGKIVAGRYRLERQLARGGMGVVWIATHLSLDAPVAIKFLGAALPGLPEALARFEREARATAQLRGPHVVQILDHGLEGDVPFIVMELLCGEDLAARLKRDGRLSAREVARVVAQIATALTTAHAAGIVHRDLKPANVFLARDPDGEIAKVLDFGVAKVLGPESLDVTGTDDVFGSPLYMSPEQIRGAKAVDHRADLWALGVLAFKALTGEAPFRGASSGEILVTVATERAVQASTLMPDLPAGIDAFFERALEKDPARRFQTAKELSAALTALLVPDAPGIAWTPSAPPASQPPEPSRPARAMTADPPRHAEDGLVSTARATRPRPLSIALVACLALAALGIAGALGRASRDAVTPVLASASAPTPPVARDDTATIWSVPVGDSRAVGPVSALVTIVEFGEFQCALSQRAEPLIARILESYRGKTRLVWKDYYTAPHQRAEPAAHFVREALAQAGPEVAWGAHRVLFETRELDDDGLIRAAKGFRLDVSGVRAAIQDRRYQDRIDADTALGDALEITITPTFFVNGRRLAGLPPFDVFKRVVEEELERAGALVAAGAPPEQVYSRLVEGARGGSPPERRAVAGVANTAPVRGSSAARVLVQEFGDLDDPLTRLAEPTVREVLDRYGDRVALVWRDRPVTGRPTSLLAAIAAREAAREKGNAAFWSMHDRLLGDGSQSELGARMLEGFAAQIGLRPGDFRAGMESPEHRLRIDADVAAATGAEITATPAFLVSRAPTGGSAARSEGYFLSGPPTFRKLKRLIDRALAEETR